jgi:FkbM family methyltransferase
MKKFLKPIFSILPNSAQAGIRRWYWTAKSDLLYRRLYRLLDLEYTLEYGVSLQVRSKGEWWVYNDIFVNQEYDLPISAALDSYSGRPLTVLDLGANVGYFALRIIDLARQKGMEDFALDITMVEGSPAIFGELERRLRSQSLPEARLSLVHGLAGLPAGKGVMHESALHVKNTIMGSATSAGTPVAFVDLQELMQGREEIDLLKCDIEGAELLFLENYEGLLRKIKTAVFELHHELCDTRRCVSILEGLGFRQAVLRNAGSFSVCYFSRA